MFYENSRQTERVMLISVDTGELSAEESLSELSELTKTAGGEVALTLTQKLSSPNPATYIGSGRTEEMRSACENYDIDLVIADGELSPAQLKNLEALTGVRVIDRTMLILDIFAGRARSSEGKLQVELAQLEYSLPFLTGKGRKLSRLGGGIGTRGPGESKLESDRRHIRRRIHSLEQELQGLEARRCSMRERRKKDGVISAVIVGYTNAGKSTLMNTLTNAGVLAEDKLFATLDPTARRLALPSGRDIMLIDTVGFVRRLPHKLIEAFKSTLEEAKQADLILNVCDASSPECSEHIKVTNDLLRELECESVPVITVMNKCDTVPDIYDLPVIGSTVFISALNKTGIRELLDAIDGALPRTHTQVRLLIPFDKGSVISEIRKDGVVKSEKYTENGTLIEASVNIRRLDGLKQYVY